MTGQDRIAMNRKNGTGNGEKKAYEQIFPL